MTKRVHGDTEKQGPESSKPRKKHPQIITRQFVDPELLLRVEKQQRGEGLLSCRKLLLRLRSRDARDRASAGTGLLSRAFGRCFPGRPSEPGEAPGWAHAGRSKRREREREMPSTL